MPDPGEPSKEQEKLRERRQKFVDELLAEIEVQKAKLNQESPQRPNYAPPKKGAPVADRFC